MRMENEPHDESDGADDEEHGNNCGDKAAEEGSAPLVVRRGIVWIGVVVSCWQWCGVRVGCAGGGGCGGVARLRRRVAVGIVARLPLVVAWWIACYWFVWIFHGRTEVESFL
uniref:Transmembrane protein n=1 Tax=Nelumbo nucifera TaxID=4432 RepID=A0A823A2S3_NELNU|nr:TPA_asm: hypothetical protein HUJ06_018325 [Nelumbo nucifera]